MTSTENLILHDLFDIKGGGERLVMTLLEGLNADLITGYHSEDSYDLKTVSGQVFNLNASSRFAGFKTIALANGFKKIIPLENQYNNIIYSGVVCPLSVNNFQSAHNIYYCHTPPRFVYDKSSFYSQNLSWLSKQGLKWLVNWFKPQYEQAIAQMDVVVTNSQFVKQRISKYLQLDATVIYPPCDTQYFKFIEQGDYYLSMARLDPLKKIDAIIEAFKRMPDKKLLIASGGKSLKNLTKLADGYHNISFTGWIEDKQLKKLLGRCIASLYVPEDEDFGMSPVESMSAGKPVICSDHGGMTESVIDGETGYYVNHDNLIEEIIDKVNMLNKVQAFKMKSACEFRAQKFDNKNFIRQMKQILKPSV
ncbi:MAG: glycosyltransferase [Proteobacteria bacterium]|nr:glycosyltransferase [Pseudomonadota bacterium]